jgi:lysophospholipase L1-like esterase
VIFNKKGEHQMFRKNTVFAIAAVMLIALSVGPIQSIAAAPTKIMCLGDSITGSPGCWRAFLWQNLTNNGYTNIDFVGTLPPQGCGFTYDGENEGHGGILATNMANNNELPPWLAATSPDIVMMFLGTNDTWSSRGTSVILTAFTKLIGQMRTQNPNMKILVAQITPLNPSGCTACNPNVIDLNSQIPAWAAGLSTTQSPIGVVDQYTGFDTTTDTADGCHPNDSGTQKIWQKWYPALVNLLSGGTVTTAPTAVPTSGPTATPFQCLYSRGDINGNGTIDIVDALIVAQYYVGIYSGTIDLCFGDVNCDGTINIVDALVIAQCYVGLPCNKC